jgi:hypothetical protein
MSLPARDLRRVYKIWQELRAPMNEPLASLTGKTWALYLRQARIVPTSILKWPEILQALDQLASLSTKNTSEGDHEDDEEEDEARKMMETRMKKNVKNSVMPFHHRGYAQMGMEKTLVRFNAMGEKQVERIPVMLVPSSSVREREAKQHKTRRSRTQDHHKRGTKEDDPEKDEHEHVNDNHDDTTATAPFVHEAVTKFEKKVYLPLAWARHWRPGSCWCSSEIRVIRSDEQNLLTPQGSSAAMETVRHPTCMKFILFYKGFLEGESWKDTCLEECLKKCLIGSMSCTQKY